MLPFPNNLWDFVQVYWPLPCAEPVAALRLILVLDPKIVDVRRLVVLIQFHFLDIRWFVQFWILPHQRHRNYHVAHHRDFWLLRRYLYLSEPSFWMHAMQLTLRTPFVPTELFKSPIQCRGSLHILVQIRSGKKFIFSPASHSIVLMLSFIRVLVIKKRFRGVRPNHNR